MKKISFAIFLAFASFVAVVQGQDESFRKAFGERFSGSQLTPPLPLPRVGADSIHRWNQITVHPAANRCGVGAVVGKCGRSACRG